MLASSMYLSGCGLFGGDKTEKIDPPKTVSSLKKGESLTGDKDKQTNAVDEKNTIMTELYLIDKNGYVVSQALPLPNEKGIATKALEYLVVDGPGQNIIPNGFRAVLPADTKISVDVKKMGQQRLIFQRNLMVMIKKTKRKLCNQSHGH